MLSYCEPLIDRDVLYNARIKMYPNEILKYTVFNKFIYNPDKFELINKKTSEPKPKSMVTLTLDKDKIDRYDKKRNK